MIGVSLYILSVVLGFVYLVHSNIDGSDDR